MTTQAAVAEFEAQGSLPPGTEGWWKVWGARVSSIRTGDLIFLKGQDDGEPEGHLIAGTFEAKATGLRRGFIVDNEERFTLGMLCPVVVLRRDTHNILA
jgi:hypothetical protein